MESSNSGSVRRWRSVNMRLPSAVWPGASTATSPQSCRACKSGITKLQVGQSSLTKHSSVGPARPVGKAKSVPPASAREKGGSKLLIAAP